MNNTASTQGDTISRSALLYAFNKWLGCDDIPAAIVVDIIEDAPAVEPQMPREYRQALESLNFIKERYILLEKSPADSPFDLMTAKLPEPEKPETRACFNCKHNDKKFYNAPCNVCGDNLNCWEEESQAGQQNETK